MISAARRPCFAAVALTTAGATTGVATLGVGTDVIDDARTGAGRIFGCGAPDDIAARRASAVSRADFEMSPRPEFSLIDSAVRNSVFARSRSPMRSNVSPRPVNAGA